MSKNIKSNEIAITLWVCSTTFWDEMQGGDPGPWKIYRNKKEVNCCKDRDICKPMKVKLIKES